MKRVAIFRSDLLSISETFIREQVAALRTWEPVFVGRRPVAGGLQTPGIPREIVPEPSNRVLRVLRYWLGLPEAPLAARLKGMGVALVHAHFGMDATDIWPSVKAAGLPMLVTLHGCDIRIHRSWWEQGREGLARRAYPRRLLAMGRDPRVQFVAVSESIRRRAIEFGIPEEKVTVGHIGIDTRRFRPANVPLVQRPRRILFVGRMVEKKAPLLMVRVFGEVRKRVPEAELTMIGDGPLLAQARRLAQDLDTPVTFLGAQPWDSVLAHMHEARVFCLPSVTAANGDAEGLPLVVLEAQAAGVPVVTSACGAAEEGVVDGVTGIACAEGAMEDLVRGISGFLTDDRAAEAASVAAVDFIRNRFDIRACSQRLEEQYDERRGDASPVGS